MDLVYKVKDRPPIGQVFIFALQQLLAILAATITVPMVINDHMLKTFGEGNYIPMSTGAALFGAGVGTLVYLVFTKFKSPVFLGSSFAFLGSMMAAFAGGVSMSLGYLGLILGAAFAGIVYVLISLIVKYAGTAWIDKVMPAVVIGPTVAIIGLSLAGNAVGQALGDGGNMSVTGALSIVCALVTLITTIVCSVYGKKMMKMIPFVIGILAGYVVAAIFTAFSYIDGAESMRIIDFTVFKQLTELKAWFPQFTFVELFTKDYVAPGGNVGAYIGSIAVAYIPVAFVVFAEHLADHKNISSIIETDLLEDPGLHRTLLGDGVGSIAGAIFGGCPNTTYGESVGCVAISGNASVITIFVTACMAIVASFIAPFVLFLGSIPSCVMGGVCIALYGFIAVSGLKMIQNVDLGDNRNLFVVSVILIAGVGGMALSFGYNNAAGAWQNVVQLTPVATALILGMIVNVIVNLKKPSEHEVAADAGAEAGGEIADDAPQEEIPAPQEEVKENAEE